MIGAASNGVNSWLYKGYSSNPLGLLNNSSGFDLQAIKSQNNSLVVNLMGSYNASLAQTTNLLTDMKSMSESARAISFINAPAFNRAQAISSDDKVVSASSTAINSSLSYDVNVKQLATGQTNQSTNLKSSDLSVMGEGKKSFSLDVVGKTVDLSVDITKDDTNKSALDKIAKAINSSKTGVSASVKTGEDGNISLVMSGSTGVKNSFDIKGTDISSLGINKTVSATDAKYSINGRDYTSDSNKVKTSDGRINLELKSVGTSKVSSSYDGASATSLVSGFVDSLNKVMNSLADMPASRKVAGLAKTLKINSFDAGEMANIGISFDKNGTLKVDEKKMTSAFSDPKERTRAMRLVSSLAQKGQEAFRQAQTSKKQIINEVYQSNFTKIYPQNQRGALLDIFA